MLRNNCRAVPPFTGSLRLHVEEQKRRDRGRVVGAVLFSRLILSSRRRNPRLPRFVGRARRCSHHRQRPVVIRSQCCWHWDWRHVLITYLQFIYKRRVTASFDTQFYKTGCCGSPLCSLIMQPTKAAHPLNLLQTANSTRTELELTNRLTRSLFLY